MLRELRRARQDARRGQREQAAELLESWLAEPRKADYPWWGRALRGLSSLFAAALGAFGGSVGTVLLLHNQFSWHLNGQASRAVEVAVAVAAVMGVAALIGASVALAVWQGALTWMGLAD